VSVILNSSWRDEFAIPRTHIDRPCELMANEDTTGTATPQHFVAQRAIRVARVIVSVRTSEDDVHSIDELCRRSLVGVAASTFRDWCRGEGIRAGAALDLARILRALHISLADGCLPSECLDADYRTIRALIDRGGLSELLTSRSTTMCELCLTQRYVSNPMIIREIVRLWADDTAASR
jgi:hypothetical protein